MFSNINMSVVKILKDKFEDLFQYFLVQKGFIHFLIIELKTKYKIGGAAT